MEKRMAAPRACPPMFCPDPNDNNRRLQSMLLQSEEMLHLIKANFTQMMAIMKTELDISNKDKDKYHLDAIELRRDKAFLEGELNLYQKKCKEHFVDSLRGIPNVTKEFLKRIDDLFSKHISFQLTCDKQKIQLEDIRENCSSLSREVESKLQSYLNVVGNQFTKINGENAKYETENKRLKEDAEWCNKNRSAMSRENRKNLQQFQLKNDQESEKLLLENRKLKEENNLKDQLISVKEKQSQMLAQTIETLNTSLASCKPLMRPNPFMPNPYGLPNMPNAGGTGLSSTGLSKPNMPGTGPAGPVFSGFNGAGSNTRLGSTGTGATGSLAPAGTGILSNGLGSTGLGGSGLSRTGLAQTGTGVGGVSPGLTGFGSAGTATGNIGQSGTGSTAFSSAGSVGVGMGKPVVGGAGFGSVGSNAPGNGATLGGARTTVAGSDGQTLSQAQINLHLKELHRYLIPN
ncbi:plasmalemma vesicle associated protein a [Pimephales promelas]|nr:plasmalemma vesicle associated protein a [Pimephales promelas]KAG1969578.1 plasmalemma vesicle associated protein a [Pimephales promelas]